ncbi:MAG: hypothetical protein PHH36_08600 [Sideroxydans sp.]|nr:hypothetical protein [Sideroxydans sp.]
MIDNIMFYVFGLFVVAAIIYLAIFLFYEKSLKAIEHDEKLIQSESAPLSLNIRTIKRFSSSHPVAGLIYRGLFYYMLGAVPGIIVLMVLKSIS